MNPRLNLPYVNILIGDGKFDYEDVYVIAEAVARKSRTLYEAGKALSPNRSNNSSRAGSIHVDEDGKDYVKGSNLNDAFDKLKGQ